MPGAEVSFGLIKPAQPATLKITEEEVDTVRVEMILSIIGLARRTRFPMPSVTFSRAPQRHIAPRASGIFWRTRLRSTNANGVCSRWVQCDDFLYTNVMLPVVAVSAGTP